MMSRTVRLLIADDHVMFRRSLRALLELDPCFEVVGEAGNGRHLLALVDSTPADVILLDIAMPGLDGLEVLESLDEVRRAGVIVLTANASRDEFARVSRLGAGGLLLKDVELEVLHAAVRRVAAGV
ncbi:MAG: DNA-binding response regulator, partial [Acidobacteria bacterium]